MVLAKRKEGSKVGLMTPQKKKTTTESIALFKQTLEGNNYSPQSIKAYMGDLGQFVEWLKTRRVDWDIPYRIERINIVEFINYLATRKATASTRQRKLAAIRGLLKFLKDNQIIFGNPQTRLKGRFERNAIRQYSSRRSTKHCYKWREEMREILLSSCSFYNPDCGLASW